MSFLEQYYNNYDEEGRLLSRHGQVEYLTTMKYISECLSGMVEPKILEVGAGTGRYSVALAKEARSQNPDALIMVDAVTSAFAMDLRIKDMDPDALVFGTKENAAIRAIRSATILFEKALAPSLIFKFLR